MNKAVVIIFAICVGFMFGMVCNRGWIRMQEREAAKAYCHQQCPLCRSK